MSAEAQDMGHSRDRISFGCIGAGGCVSGRLTPATDAIVNDIAVISRWCAIMTSPFLHLPDRAPPSRGAPYP